jgi:hypothetical protein
LDIPIVDRGQTPAAQAAQRRLESAARVVDVVLGHHMMIYRSNVHRILLALEPTPIDQMRAHAAP